MELTNLEIEHKWWAKAKAVPKDKRGRDLKGVLHRYEVLDHWDSILLQHQGPPSDLPAEQQTKLLVSLLKAYFVSYEFDYLSEAVQTALLHLLKPHVENGRTTSDGGYKMSVSSNAGLANFFPITPQSLLKASMAALFYQLHGLSDQVLLISGVVTMVVQDLLSPNDKARLQSLLQRNEPQFGVTELLWVMASVRSAAALAQPPTTHNLLQAKAAGSDMLRLKPDIPHAHAVVGHVLMMIGDLVLARKILEQGIQVADETNSQSHACLLRFELAQALIIGADGETFKKGDVEELVIKGDRLHKELRKWKHPGTMNVLLDYQYRVHELLKDCPQHHASPDSRRLQRMSLSQAKELQRGPSYGVCHGCGHMFPQLWTCKACRSVRYCSTKCQKAHWKEHKHECRCMQQDRATEAHG